MGCLVYVEDPGPKLSTEGCLVLVELSLGHTKSEGCLLLVEDPWAILSTEGCLVLVEDTRAIQSSRRVFGASGESLGHTKHQKGVFCLWRIPGPY